jgi:tetratricopeptide (TPR) repeat protein
VGFELGVSAWQYALNQCVIVIDYLRLAVWPFPVVLDYGEPRDITFAHAAPYGVALGLLGVAAFAALVRRPKLGFAAIWFFAVLAPTSSFVPIASEVGAERRVYLPSAGLIILGAVCVGWLLSRVEDLLIRPKGRREGEPVRTPRRVSAPAVVVALAAVLPFATARRNLVYDNPMGLWRTAIEAVPWNPRAHVNLGLALAQVGDRQAAIAKYRDALKLDPVDPEAHYNLGNALSLAGDLDEAIKHYDIAIESARKEGGTWPVEAMRQWLETLRGVEDGAARHMSFARLLRRQNRIDEVIIHYDHAMRLRSDWAQPRARLAWILATSTNDAYRDATRALELASRAAKLTGGRDPLILDILAAAYAEAGRFEDAVATAQQAIELASAAGRDKWLTPLRRHLEHYRESRPWRE